VVAQEFSGADTHEGPFSHVSSVMGVVFVLARLLADVNHAIIAAIVLVIATTGGLGDGITRAQFTPEPTIVVILAHATVVIVGGFAVNLRAVDDLVVGLARLHVDGTSGFLNDYRLIPRNDNGVGPGTTRIIGLTVLTFVVVPFGAVVDLPVIPRQHGGVVAIGGATDDELSLAGVGIFAAIEEVAITIAISIFVG
jgi:hypothetical protein